MSPIEVAFEQFKLTYRDALQAEARLVASHDDIELNLMRKAADQAWASANKFEAELKWLFPRRRTR